MLVLSRRLRQAIIISDPAAPENAIEVTVVGVGDDEVRLGVNAPRELSVRRPEVAVSPPATGRLRGNGR